MEEGFAGQASKNLAQSREGHIARCRRHSNNIEAEAPREAAQTADKQPREGQREVVGEQDEQDKDVSPREWMAWLSARQKEVWANNPLHDELRRRRIRLKGNGFEMEWGVAQACIDVLRGMQARPEDAATFAALVTLVRPRGVTRRPSKVSPKELAALKQQAPFLVREDGSVVEEYAKVLDASYEEVTTGEGVVLCDPVAYTKDFIEQYAAVDNRVQTELARLTPDAAVKAIRGQRGQGDVPPR